MLTALTMLLLGALALAGEPDDPTRHAGRIIASVELVAGDGALVDEDLRPLLRAEQGQPFDPATVRLDLRTLYRVTPLAAVEAEASPWPIVDDQTGDLIEGLKLRYVLYPSARVSEVRAQGGDRQAGRLARTAARLAEGTPFDPVEDPPAVAERVTRALQARGFPDAQVEVESFPDRDDPFQLEVWLRLDPGPARELRELTIDGLPSELKERRVRRWARRAGLKRGNPIAEDALTRTRYALRARLARLGGGTAADFFLGPRGTQRLIRLGVLPPGGWVQARVQVEQRELPDGGVGVHIELDPGRRLLLRTSGISQSATVRALSIDERLRLTRGFLESANEQTEAWLATRGYTNARATVRLIETPRTQELVVAVTRGPRHRRKPFTFEGNTTLSDNQLRTVLNQASPDVLRRRRLTDAALQRGLSAMRDLYRAVGHEEVEFTLDPPRVRSRTPLLTLDRSRKWISQHIRIDEGRATRLRRLELVGPAPDVALDPIRGALERLDGGPYSPQGLQALAQRIVDLHRSAGYLDARARVRPAATDDGDYTAAIEIEPGERILLRSFATRGNRRVSGRYLRRTLAPQVGEVLDGETLDRLRQRLYDLGMFSSVDLTLLGDDAARDLVVDLRERPRHTVETGFGFASDQGARLLGRWTLRNLFAAADRVDTNALVGLRFAGTGSWVPLPEYRLGSTYSLPLSSVNELALNLIGLEELQERNWRLQRRAVGVQWVYQPRRSTLFQVRTLLEHRRLAGVDPGALLKTDVWADPALRLPSAPSIDTRGRLVDQIEIVWLDDHRDNPLQPTRGVLGSTRVAFSPQLIQPGYARHLRVPLVAAEARAAAVAPLGALSLRVNAEGGHQRVVRIGPIATFDVDESPAALAVPVEERYRLGGTASLRGFRRDGVGPHQGVRPLDLAWPDALGPIIGETLRRDDTRFVPTGGDTFARVTADLLIPLPVLGLTDWQGYDLALFLDAGQVWFASTSAATPDRGDIPWIRGSAGVGLRVLTPVGPLQTDLAFNPRPMRILREPPARLHLSLGTLF